ncbi:hypothetical protein RHMOL_Rhmol09G0066800 [Rhododendron molle]|uniref:Uncharacterized protein n=1 Tax=Rhododendron molle TaxID=49168 RepID=A0ACC0MAT1_RHOML|nr:hypothetical protein RHMOL_Rhmol09G0066800 [Rhododendron molle]
MVVLWWRRRRGSGGGGGGGVVVVQWWRPWRCGGGGGGGGVVVVVAWCGGGLEWWWWWWWRWSGGCTIVALWWRQWRGSGGGGGLEWRWWYDAKTARRKSALTCAKAAIIVPPSFQAALINSTRQSTNLRMCNDVSRLEIEEYESDSPDDMDFSPFAPVPEEDSASHMSSNDTSENQEDALSSI